MRAENHAAIQIGPYLVAVDTEECLVATRIWFDTRCGTLEVETEEVDCLVLKEVSC